MPIVNLWFLSLEDYADLAEANVLARLLSPDEMRRADRFHFDRDRRNFIRCRAALRSVLALELKSDPRMLRFHYGPYGKPVVDLDPCDLRFNVSHSGERAVIAVTRGYDVGVDIEHRRAIPDSDSLAALIFSDEERRVLELAIDKVGAFLNAWTRKEAVIKALGLGFSAPLRSITVSLGECAEVRAIHHRAPTDWTLVDLSDGTEVVCVAVSTARAGVCVRDDSECALAAFAF